VGKLTISKTYECDVCNISMTGEVDLRAHQAGKSHLAKLSRAAAGASINSTQSVSQGEKNKPVAFKCKVCNISMTGEADLKAHKAGKSHLSKLNQPGGGLVKLAVAENKGQSAVFECKVCNISMTGEAAMRIHKIGLSHLAKLNQLNAGAKAFECNVCDVVLNSEVDLKNHIAGKNHQAKANRSMSTNGAKVKESAPKFECKPCGVTMTGEVQGHSE
jgi:hypothetical protein